MLPIVFGMPALLLLLVAVIGGPIYYFTKRDIAYQATKGQADDVRLQCWYNK